MFLPGQDDINKAVKMLNEGVAALPPDSCMDLLVLPIYAALPPDLQVPLQWIQPRALIQRIEVGGHQQSRLHVKRLSPNGAPACAPCTSNRAAR